MEGDLKDIDKKFILSKRQIDEESLDADRCTYVWNHLYIPCYSKVDFWKDTEFSNCISRGKNRGKHRGYVVYNSHNVTVNISGDTTFNFKDKKYIFFKRLVEEDKEFSAEDKQKYLKVLDDCKSMVYSFHNFALMPRTGGLNNFKGSHMDRLDKFLFFLNEYYNDKERCINNPIFSQARGGGKDKEICEKNKTHQKKCLKQFLEPIKSVYKYCEYFYLIEDKELIDALIKNGKTPINSGRTVVAYMELAKKFWKKRDEVINK